MIVGLTGGIATGKTTVSKLFAKYGAIIVSADELGHKALHSTGGAYEAVKQRFGFLPGLLDSTGEINRRILGYHVFLNDGEMKDLDAIVHPVVSGMFQDIVAAQHKPHETVLMYECAILYECNLDRQINMPFVVATWCPEELQIERLMARNGLDRSQALQRIEKQLPADAKKEWAHFVINTDATMDQIEEQTKRVYNALVTSLKSVP